MSMIKTRPEHPAQHPAPRPPFSNAELCSGCLFNVEQEEHDGVRFVTFEVLTLTLTLPLPLNPKP